MTIDLRALQRPLKDRYRADPASAKYTLTAVARQGETPMECTLRIGGHDYASQAHAGVGGPGTEPCSGDVLLGSLAACAQITCQMVATAMGIQLESVQATVDGVWDARGTLGIARDAPVGFASMRLRLDIDAPTASPEQIASLQEKTEQYCVVMQTLLHPPQIEVVWQDGES